MTLQIIRGRTFGPMRRVVFGPPGVGKSSFSATPKVIALDCERGLDHIGCDRVPWAPTFDGNLALIREMCIGAGAWDTVMLDTADALEQQAAKEICAKEKKLSLADFGWGDGFHMVAARWRELLFILEGAKAKNRSVHLVGHVTTATIKDPTLPKDHSKQIASLTKHSWGATHQWADAVLFADYARGMVEGRAIMTGERLLRTVAGTGYDAKHRPNIAPELPLSWKAYEREFKRYERQAKDIVDRILSLTTTPELRAKAEAYVRDAGEDVEKLVRIEVNLETKIKETNGVLAPDPSGPAPATSPVPQATETK